MNVTSNPSCRRAPAICSPRKTSTPLTRASGTRGPGISWNSSGHGAHATELSAGEEDGVLGELTVKLQQLDRSGLAQKAVQGYRWDEDRIGPVRLRAAGARTGLDPPALEPAPGSERQRGAVADRTATPPSTPHGSARVGDTRRCSPSVTRSFRGLARSTRPAPRAPRRRWRTRRCERRRRGSGSRGDTSSRARSDSPRPPRGPRPHPKCRPAWRLSLAASCPLPQ